MKYFFIYLFIYISFFSSAQELTFDWSGCYGSHGHNQPDGVGILPNGNTIFSMTVLGQDPAFNNYHDGHDIWVVILDDAGFIVDNKCFGGSNNDVPVAIEVGEDFIYIIGYTKSTDGDALSEPIGNPIQDLWIIKTDFDLNIIWEKKYGPLGPCWLASSDLRANDGLVVITDFFNQGGGDVSQYYGGTDIWAFEIDSEGEMLWEKTLGNAYENTAGNILSTDHNTTMILGETSHSGDMVDCDCHSTDGLTRDIWLVELDDQGEIIWQDCFGGSNWELGLDILQEKNGYTLFCNTSSNDGDVSDNHSEGITDLWLVHINNQGLVEWQSCFGGTDEDLAKQFYKTSNDGYVLVGLNASDDGDASFNHGAVINSFDVWVVILDSNRNILWEHSYGGYYNNNPTRNSIAQRGEMDFVIASVTKENEIGNGDINCTPYPIDEDDSNWIFRIYDPTIGANTLDNDYSSLSVYPNPATDHVFIDLPVYNDMAELEIIDIFGNSIARLVAYPKQNQLIWNCSNAASGVYFYHTEINDVFYRGRIVINK